MFDPALNGYWGGQTVEAAMDTVFDLINDHRTKIDGIKISLLDARHEIALRRRLPSGVHLYTGDDFNYADMIAGDEGGYSHALLGIFAAIAPAASTALSALAEGDETRFRAIIDPTVPLSRHLFAAPTQFYKTGVVFLAYLNGHQDHFTMVAGLEKRPLDRTPRRSIPLGRSSRPSRRPGNRRPPHEGSDGRARRPVMGLRDFSHNDRWLSINTATLRRQGDLIQILEGCARAGIRAVAPWRDQVAAIGIERAARCLHDNQLALSGYCRGGMFPADPVRRQAVRDDNRRAVDEALALGAPCIVLVVGGLATILAARLACQ